MGGSEGRVESGGKTGVLDETSRVELR